MKKQKPKINEYSWQQIAKIAWYFIGQNKGKFVFWFVVMSLVYIYPLIPTWLMGLSVDFLTNYTVGSDLSFFYQIALVYALSYGANSMLRLTGKEQMSIISSQTHFNIRTESFNRLMDFSITWHDKEDSGNKIQKIIAGSMAIRDMIKQLYRSSGVFNTGWQIISILIVFLFLDIKFLFFLVAFMFCFFLIEYIFYRRIYEAEVQLNIAAEKSSGTYFESSSNVVTVKSLGLQGSIDNKVKSSEEVLKEKAIISTKLGHGKWKVFQLLNSVSYFIFFLLILDAFQLGNISVGFILVYFKYFEDLKEASSSLTELITEYSQFKSKAVRLLPFFENELKNTSHQINDFPNDWDKIELRDASFTYSTNSKDFSIKNLNLDIPKNSKIGIVGQSGSGKSTLAKLLLGLYDLKSGSYKIGNIDYGSIKRNQIHQKISTVLQESELFNTSLKENILLLRDISEELFAKAIEIAELQPVIDKLPNGLDTKIGEKGYRLSGGERQRLGIARAICQDPEILILDEATSSLDSKTELLIQEKLEQQLSSKTMVIIAHRLSTLKNVDHIYVFETGQIVEQGTFKELSEKQGSKFAEMYKIQNSST